MGGLFGSKTPQAENQPALTGVPVQTSVEGKVIPLVFGTTRVAPNLIGLWDFIAIPHSESSGGKGGAAGGGGKGGGGGTTYEYRSALAMALCEGPIQRYGRLFVNKGISGRPGDAGFSEFLGTYPQSPWTYLSTNHPSDALGYNGVAYIAAPTFAYGSSANLPNFNIEVFAKFSDEGPNQADAPAHRIITNLLTDSRSGAGFPAAYLGSLTSYIDWTYACGFFLSVAYTDQRAISESLSDIAQLTLAEFVWSAGKLHLVPYGDTQASGNGRVYTPPSAPEFDLDDDDFIAPPGADPVQLVRKRAADVSNSIALEYLNRDNNYSPATASDKDDALIRVAGVRQAAVIDGHMFCTTAPAQLSVSLQLRRETIRNRYSFVLDQRFIALDPMDIVSITDEQLGLDRQWVRILEITENEDLTLGFLVEEYLQGTGTPARNTFEAGAGFNADFNVEPGSINPPIIFEPTYPLVSSLQIMAAVSGVDLENWGGCFVHVSTDGQNYQRLATPIRGAARMGLLSAALPTIAQASVGPTIDATNTLKVDVSESAAELISDTQAGMLDLNCLCYVGGELLAYQTATLTAASKYNLTTLNRGAYNSGIAAHAAGSPFARMDGSIYTVPFTPDRVGQVLYFKFTSFNIYGGGQQGLADVEPYLYTVTGIALSGPVAGITELRDVFVDHVNSLYWKEVNDFRPIQYEVRKGDTFATAIPIVRQAHPPFVTQGNGRYWIAAVTTPLSGLTIYGAPTSIDVEIAMLSFGAEVAEADFTPISIHDEKVEGWTGTFYGGAGKDVTNNTIRTGGGASVLDETDFLGISDLINLGVQQSGGYVQPDTNWVDVGRIAPCLVNVEFNGAGSPVGQDILGAGDFLGLADVLGAESTKLIDVYVENSISLTKFRELYPLDDLYAQEDLYASGNWAPWERYSPGVKRFRAIRHRMVLVTNDGNTICFGLALKVTISAPKRIDHYGPIAVSGAGVAIVFRPDGASEDAAFNGGPNGQALPMPYGQIFEALNGDRLLITALTATGMYIQAVDAAGLPVSRTVNVLNVEGY